MCIFLLLISIPFTLHKKRLTTKNSPRDALLAPAHGIPIGTHTCKYVFQQAPTGLGQEGARRAHTVGDHDSTRTVVCLKDGEHEF
jgi:hypothetical protein